MKKTAERSNERNKTIKQTMTFKATPQEMYEIFMNSRKHTVATGMKAKVSRRIGGKLSAGGGYISGENVELVPDRKIVQRWRGEDWLEGHYSLASFVLVKVREGTKLKLTQTGVPAEQFDNVSEGWHTFYWNPIAKWLETTSRQSIARK